MGRVYDALKRAAETGGRRKTDEPHRQEQTANGNGHGTHPWDRSSLFAVPNAVSSSTFSASTAHTEVFAGLALPGEVASRAAGATLDAAGSTRALECVSLDISPTRVEPHLVAITQPRSAYCEQFRSLRTRIIHASERKQMQSFVITSVGVGEGKTLTALNLAWLLAQTDGVRALLIDSDLRNPCVTDYFGIQDEATQGLSEVLAEEATLEESIVRLEPAGLYLLPGGAARDDCAEMLSGPRFERVLKDARALFDYVIIDAPPLGIFTDASVLINRADGAMLVVRSGKTRYGAVDRLLDTLPRGRMLGVVLNRSQEELEESGNYYGRRSYKKQEDEVTEAVVASE
ncbi:MAG: CpsD/CapB family tyrosine-protein kinase [Acidobacteria bacterium]|nr:CpsD/CapB family tyrosine-protein kinase [Acidobacteriota bacterium]